MQKATEQTEHDITTVDVLPSLCPAASQMLCNEHHSAPMHSCKCHVLSMMLMHKEVNPTNANEPENKYCLFHCRIRVKVKHSGIVQTCAKEEKCSKKKSLFRRKG